MDRPDTRTEDRGRRARRLGVREWLQIAALVATAASVVWQGGKVTGELENVAKRVGEVEVSVKGLGGQITTQQIQSSEVRVRVDTHEKELNSIDRRLSRVERGGRPSEE